jgi:phosphatidate cytidylyltransferase
MSTFQQRALTAVIFAAVMLVGLFWNISSFILLFGAIGIGSWWEFLNMALINEPTKKLRIGLVIGLWVLVLTLLAIYSYYTLTSGVSPNFTLHMLSTIFVFVTPLLLSFPLLLIELFLKSEKPFHNIGIVILSFYYPLLSFVLIFQLISKQEFSFDTFSANGFTPNIVAGTLFLTWANDTFAYLIGSKIGKTPLLPRISPRKTWEGTIGGALMCMLTGVAISYAFTELTLINWMIVGGIVAIFGTLGDLIESMLKRSVGVKDSGSFMPGHGGFLDRFDAFIFAVPFVYLYLIVLK